MDLMGIFAVIATYNGEHWIEKCINSLRSSSLPINIKIVDNASTDNTIKIIKEQYPDVDVLQSSENLGFGRANNLGIRKALDEGADFLFLLNQDAWINESTVETLVNVMGKDPEIGIISPVHLNGLGTALDYPFSLYLTPDCCPFFYSDLYTRKHDMKLFYEMEFVNAAAWLVSKNCMLAVGGFSPIFYHYGEDEDFVNKAKYVGYKIGCCPHAVAYHDRDKRDNKIALFSPAYFKKMQIYYMVLFSNPHLKKTYKKMVVRSCCALAHSIYYFFGLKLYFAWGAFKEAVLVIGVYYKVTFYKGSLQKIGLTNK